MTQSLHAITILPDNGEQALEHGRRERPHSGRARGLLKEQRVQGPITVSGFYGTNRDGEEAYGYDGHSSILQRRMIKWIVRSCDLVCRVWA